MPTWVAVYTRNCSALQLKLAIKNITTTVCYKCYLTWPAPNKPSYSQDGNSTRRPLAPIAYERCWSAHYIYSLPMTGRLTYPPCDWTVPLPTKRSTYSTVSAEHTTQTVNITKIHWPYLVYTKLPCSKKSITNWSF